MDKYESNQRKTTNPASGRVRIQRVEKEAKAANNCQPAKRKMEPPAAVRFNLIAEKRLDLALQGIDQLLESEQQLLHLIFTSEQP